jgi:pimeloyl-ACP methyl ester carboxylesterase
LDVSAKSGENPPPAYVASMPERFSDLEILPIDECGHWTQQDKPDALNGILVDWLTRRFH